MVRLSVNIEKNLESTKLINNPPSLVLGFFILKFDYIYQYGKKTHSPSPYQVIKEFCIL
jgi:hypothetical protein